MKILVRNSDGVVIYARDDLVLSDIEVGGDGWRDPNFTTANATLLDADLPSLWMGAVWTYTGGVWVVFDTAAHDALVVAARAPAWEAIKAERDRRKAVGYLAAGKWFHGDDGSRIQQLGLLMMGVNIPAGLQWKTLDGTFVTMTPTLAGQVFNAAAVSDQAIFAKAEQHQVAMAAAADPAGYDFSGGWPATYKGA